MAKARAMLCVVWRKDFGRGMVLVDSHFVADGRCAESRMDAFAKQN
jgi:hypothetical protein